MNPLGGNPDSSFKFLLLSRISRSVALIFTNLSVPLFLSLLGYPVIEIGLLFAGMAFFSMMIVLVLGMAGDRIGFKTVLIIAEIPSLIALLVLSFSSNPILLPVAIVIGGVGGTPGAMRGTFSPGLTAYVAKEWDSSSIRQKRIGQISGTGSLAAVGGGMLLAVHSLLLPVFGDVSSYRVLYTASLLLMAISVVSLFLISESRNRPKKARIMSSGSAKHSLKVMASNAANGAGIGLGMSILPLWWKVAYNADPFMIGTTFSLSYLMTGIFSILSSRVRFSNARNALYVASFTRTFQGLAMVAVAFSPFFILSGGLFVARSAVAGFGAPVRSAMNVQGISEGDYGTASSLQGLSMRLSQTTSGASGYLMDAYIPLPEALGGIVQFVGGLIYYGVFRGRYGKGDGST